MRELKHVRGLGYILTLEQTTSQDLNILTSYAVSVKKKKEVFPFCSQLRFSSNNSASFGRKQNGAL